MTALSLGFGAKLRPCRVVALGSLKRAIAQALANLPDMLEWISPQVIRRCHFPPIREATDPHPSTHRTDRHPVGSTVPARLSRTRGIFYDGAARCR
jgi:hypothetical protein